jgi:hypothetical protein
MATATTADATNRGLRGLADRANPAFAAAVVVIPVAALATAMTTQNLVALTYVHVMAAVLWTGIDLFMGAVLGPVLGGTSPETRSRFFRTFTPKMTFLMPSIAVVTIAGGIVLAQWLGQFPNTAPWLALLTLATLAPVVALVGHQFDTLADRRTLTVLSVVVVGSLAWLWRTLEQLVMLNHWILAALGIVTLLSVLGFGVLLPGEVRIFREIVSENPDEELIGDIGMRNAKLAGIQGLLQLSIVFVMVNIRL